MRLEFLASSSPLRGVTTTKGRTRGRRRPVLIGPTRGHNSVTTLIPTSRKACLHRPYEGSQQRRPQGGGRAGQVLIDPARGHNLMAELRGLRTPAGPHLPYEGSQHHVGGLERDGREESSSPLRGDATGGCGRRRLRWRRSSSILRGVTTPGRTGGCAVFRSLHRPYEGSQCEHRESAGGWTDRSHRLYEGSQPGMSAGARTATTTSPHRPHEGSQRVAACNRSAGGRVRPHRAGLAGRRSPVQGRASSAVAGKASVRGRFGHRSRD